MVHYPIQFPVSASGEAGIQGVWRTGTQHTDRYTEAAIPPEFNGPGGGFSPEDLYAMALLNCFMATFKVFADRAGLAYKNIEAKGLLTVDRNEEGKPWMRHMGFQIAIKLGEGGDKTQAEQLLRKTSQNCLILNSVRTEKTFEFSVS